MATNITFDDFSFLMSEGMIDSPPVVLASSEAVSALALPLVKEMGAQPKIEEPLAPKVQSPISNEQLAHPLEFQLIEAAKDKDDEKANEWVAKGADIAEAMILASKIPDNFHILYRLIHHIGKKSDIDEGVNLTEAIKRAAKSNDSNAIRTLTFYADGDLYVSYLVLASKMKECHAIIRTMLLRFPEKNYLDAALEKAAKMNDLDAFMSLIKEGAHFDRPYSYTNGYVVLPHEYFLNQSVQDEIVQRIKEAGYKTDSLEEQILRRELLLVWGVRNQEMVGSPHFFFAKKMNQYIKEFFPREEECGFSGNERDEFAEAFLNCWGAKPSLLIDNLDQGKPVVILGGTRTHCIAFALQKIGDKVKIAICNRGKGREANQGIQFYTLDSKQITEKFLVALQKKHDDIVQFCDFVTANIKTGIPGEVVEMCFQHSENCVFASSKAAYLALLRMKDETRAQDKRVGYKKCNEIYKKLSTDVRCDTAIRYSQHPEKKEEAMVLIKQKLKSKKLSNINRLNENFWKALNDPELERELKNPPKPKGFFGSLFSCIN